MTIDDINTDRITRRLDELWEIGRTSRGGVTRLAFSAEENAAIDYLSNELDDRFTVRTDSIGNIFATTDPNADHTIVLGSHLDTVFNGGRLDGTLGVVTALEAIEAVLSSDETPAYAPTLAIFRGEESSRFGQHTIGSRAAMGMLTADDLAATDHSDIPLWEAVQRAGFEPTNLSEPTIDLDSVVAYLELHIEQGRVLDKTGDDLGIVSSIRAPVRYQVRVLGADDHSGATPMTLRKDSIAATSEMILAVERIGTEASTNGDLVATVGNVRVPDGAINKVCGEVSFPIDVRSIEIEHRNRVEELLQSELKKVAKKRDLELEFEELDRSNPVRMDADLRETLTSLGDSMNLSYRVMPSGGGHDAMNFQHRSIPSGLLFVPSIDGVSHNPAEETTEDAIRAGTALLAAAIVNGPSAN